jgi:hypothetical protein
VDELSMVIGDRPGYPPRLARLVAMLEYVRQTTLLEVEGLTTAQLDHLHDAESNSVGALLHHIAALERYYQQRTLGVTGPRPSRDEELDWQAAEELGDLGRRRLRGRPLEHYVGLLAEVRARTLEGLRGKDDDWLDREERWGDRRVNHHWMWFHVLEDELNHRGQIRWLKRRLPR